MLTTVLAMLGLVSFLFAPDAQAQAADTCSSADAMVQVEIVDGQPGDSVRGELTCDGVGIVAACTATVPAGANEASCESDEIDLSGVDVASSCEDTVLQGTPDYGVSCKP